MVKKEKLGSRTYGTALLLTLAGGYLDAYTYSCRGGVFANAQTGNIVKLGLNLATGNYEKILQLLIPITSFTLGILVALHLETELKKRDIHFVKRGTLLIEIVVMIISAFLPQTQMGNLFANTMISFVCAMQMEAFKVFIGEVFATTVSTGNLRKFIENMYESRIKHDPEKMKTAWLYMIIVLTFIFGAFIGMIITEKYQVHSVVVPAVLLFLAYIVITIKRQAVIREEMEQQANS